MINLAIDFEISASMKMSKLELKILIMTGNAYTEEDMNKLMSERNSKLVNRM